MLLNHGVHGVMGIQMLAPDQVVIVGLVETRRARRPIDAAGKPCRMLDRALETAGRAIVKLTKIQPHDLRRQYFFGTEVGDFVLFVDPKKCVGFRRNQFMQTFEQCRHNRLGAQAQAAEMTNMGDHRCPFHRFIPLTALMANSLSLGSRADSIGRNRAP